jgi:hypothetical protein
VYESVSSPRVASDVSLGSSMSVTYRRLSDTGTDQAHPSSVLSTMVCVGSGVGHGSSRSQTPTIAVVREASSATRQPSRAITPVRPEQSRIQSARRVLVPPSCSYVTVAGRSRLTRITLAPSLTSAPAPAASRARNASKTARSIWYPSSPPLNRSTRSGSLPQRTVLPVERTATLVPSWEKPMRSINPSALGGSDSPSARSLLGRLESTTTSSPQLARSLAAAQPAGPAPRMTMWTSDKRRHHMGGWCPRPFFDSIERRHISGSADNLFENLLRKD